AVREVNMMLPADGRVRLFGGDPGAGDYRTRDTAVVSVLKEQMLQEHGKALPIYGPGHLFRTQDKIDFLPAVGGGITRTLEQDYAGRIFVVITSGGPSTEYEKFERTLKTPMRPVLVSLKRLPFRDFTADEFLGSKLLKKLTDGRVVSVFQGSGLTLGQLADAYVGQCCRHRCAD
ncbi:MAG: hypothetical protein ACRD9L_17185, partial [Bryobacteraceae bacterium]